MKLIEMDLKGFSMALGGDSAAPGGGSASAYAGSLSAALCAMVARLTIGKKKYENMWPLMETIRDEGDKISETLMSLVDEDTEAYNGVMAAFKLPKGTDVEKANRTEAIEDATKEAARVPMETLRTVSKLADLVSNAVHKGNANCLSDAGVGAQLMRTAAIGAAYNVRINLSGIKDSAFKNSIDKECAELLSLVKEKADEIDKIITASFSS